MVASEGVDWWVVVGRGQGVLRVIEYNGTGVSGVVDDVVRVWGFFFVLLGYLRYVYISLFEVSYQEVWSGVELREG